MPATPPHRAVFVHGWASGPEREWWPWLRASLEARGWIVIAPKLPDPMVPRVDAWVAALAEAAGAVDRSTVLVGHSVGCQTILRYLRSNPDASPAGAVFVAGWFTLTGLESEEERAVARPWLEPISLPALKTQLARSFALYSENDPFVPIENRERFAELGSTLVPLGARGHVSGIDGVTELPEALNAILSLGEDPFGASGRG